MFTNDTFFSLTSIFAFIIGLTYLYSLFNLYIGREVRKYKYILLGLNFLFLIAYIILLLIIHEYNQIPLVMLLIVLLSIIVLGIIGGFLFNEELSVNRIKEFERQLKLFKKIFKVSFISFSLVVGSISIYNIMTHEVSRVSTLRYHLDVINTDKHCDADLIFGEYNDADLFINCEDDTIGTENMTSITIYFDNVLIHENENVTEVFTEEEGILYFFNYDFDTILNFEDVEIISIEVRINSEIVVYTFDLYNYSLGYNKVTVPIWIRK